MKWYSTKTYGNDQGLSCCFRQWKADHSHCSLIHGYSLGFKLIFECDKLDARNWVMDFGGLKDLKEWLKYMFDHTLVIAESDPKYDELERLGKIGLADVRVVDAVGAEKFAELVFRKMTEILDKAREDGKLLNPSVKVKSVECFEHGANSAIFEEDNVESEFGTLTSD